MNDKFIIHDATDIAVIGGFGNLDGNLGLLKYNNEEIKQMIKENNNGNDNIRLIESLLGSLKKLDQENQELKADYGTKAQVERDLLMEENQELKEQFETGEQQYNRLVEEKEELQEQLSSITFRLEKQKEILDRIKKVCESIPADWSICGIEVVSRIENILKEVE